MGQVIYLDQRRGERSRPEPDSPPAFFFDISCPLSYLAAERVERRLGEVDWVVVDAAGVGAARTPEQLDVVRGRAEACARALRLPLVWPDRFPAAAPCARRAAAFACEIGAGPAFVLAASRLAFCGGFDLDDPETLAEAAAAAGIALEECLAAAGETWRDDELRATAQGLRSSGVSELPAIRLNRCWYEGDSGLLAAGALLQEAPPLFRSLSPVG
jgi:2-hydroxychromene-2-carboxylate isomerase